ncbi:MAG TPA: polysaccharide deacetylase family protein [Gaiellales bacterium]|jgi:peptidoglycan/xylan/chitin deacetylase (PgdA/CDA1 family)|nr:polysaccharide deacetylase family protein [Gaiellales bacterium]
MYVSGSDARRPRFAWYFLLLVAVQVCSVLHPEPAAASRLPCTIRGTNGDDVLRGTPRDDVICGGRGGDVLFGGGGRDVLRGGRGNDVIFGEGGADTLSAGPGTADVLRGGRGWDTLNARDGSPFDVLRGGRGTNLCIADAEDHRRGCDHPLVAGDAKAVPILTYHVIGDRPEGAPFPDLYVPVRVFAGQMNQLARLGDHVVTLQEVYDHWHGAPLPSRPVVVSFDDGFRNQYTQALPILHRHAWAGTLNLVLKHLHEGTYGLGPRQVRRMIAAGWEVDSHTLTHAYLPGLTGMQLEREVSGSRHALHALFNVPVNFLCYPYGAYNTAVVTATRRAGYKGATTTDPGLATPTNPYTIPRIHVTAATTFG